MSTKLKMFISYAHKDEKYLEEFKKHLSTLQRNHIIESWDDRKMTAGDKLDPEIKKHLQEADLIALLISVDFLSSYYCYEIELKQSLEKVENGDIRIIPIIVRKCKWKDSLLQPYLAATKDGKAVSSYTDPDEAWVEVVDAVQAAAHKHNKIKKDNPKKNTAEVVQEYILTSNFENELDRIEVAFQHKNKEQLLLSDLFVYPDLRNLKQEHDKLEKIISSEFLRIPDGRKFLILGSDQSGKTALAKTLFNKYHENGFLPVLLKGVDIQNTDIHKLLNKMLNEQYEKLSVEEYLDHPGRILLIDDYQDVRLNSRYEPKFLESIQGIFKTVVLFGDTAIKYNETTRVSLATFDHYEIMPLGHFKRNELIDRWNAIGQEQTIDIKELQARVDVATDNVNSVIRKNLMPPKPIYVLTVMQLLDASTPRDYSLTSYGHCYQTLIQMALQKVNIPVKDFDLYINYLSELAYFIFIAGSAKITQSQLEDFQEEYSSKFLIKSHSHIMQALMAANIIKRNGDDFEFCYRYIFYFYIGKYIADHLNIKESRLAVEHLCKNMHVEKNANILIFIIHHTKDQGIIDDICLHTALIFDNFTEAKLDANDTKHLINFIESIPRLVLEQRNSDDERKRLLKTKDEIDRDASNTEDAIEDVGVDKTLLEINRSARAVEVIGQILRNRHASLTKAQLFDLTTSAYSSGLKFLNFYLDLTKKSEAEILHLIQHVLKQRSQDAGEKAIDDKEIGKAAKKIFLMFCYGMSYSVIRKIAVCVGSAQLIPILHEIADKDPDSPAKQLIQIVTQLNFERDLPKQKLEGLFKNFEKHPFAQRLLQELVIQHLYLHEISYSERQWISDKLRIPMQAQREMQKLSAASS